MSDFEAVSELVSKTGSTYAEAKYAYEACGKDMLGAALMLEKSEQAKKSREKKASNENSQASFQNSSSDNFKKFIKQAAHHTRGLFGILCRNNLKITGKKEYISLPLIASIIIAVMLWEFALPAMIIAFFCGVSFVFTGPDFSKDHIIEFKPASSSKAAPFKDQSVEYTYTEYENSDKGFFN